MRPFLLYTLLKRPFLFNTSCKKLREKIGTSSKHYITDSSNYFELISLDTSFIPFRLSRKLPEKIVLTANVLFSTSTKLDASNDEPYPGYYLDWPSQADEEAAAAAAILPADTIIPTSQ